MSAPQLIEHPGRAIGKPSGSYMDDLVSLHKSIVLCTSCAFKFGDPRNKKYHKDRRFPFVSGRCDDCRKWENHARFYIYQGYLTEPDGKSHAWQSWLPE